MRYVLSLLLCIGVLLCNAQTKKWTLQECIDYSLENNVGVKQTQLQGEILANNLQQSQLSRLPSLNASGSHNYNIGRTIDPFTNTFNNSTIQNNAFSLSSGVLLFGGSRINNTIKQNKIGQEANGASQNVQRNTIALSVATTYLQIIQAEENLKVSESQKAITDEQLDRTQKLVNAGSANKSALLSLKAQLANDNVSIINAQNAIQIGYNALMNLMQYPLDQPLEVALPSEVNLPMGDVSTAAQLYEMALKTLPEVRQAELQIAQSEVGEKIAGAGLQPTLNAFGNINTVYSQSGKEVVTTDNIETFPIGFTQDNLEPVLSARRATVVSDKAFGDQLTDNLGQQVGFSLSVPIFNGYRSQTEVKNAKLNTRISELNLINVQNQLRNDVTTAYTNYKVSQSRYQAALANENAQQLNFDFTQKRYNAGSSNNTDLVTAKNQWSQSQVQTVNAKYEFIFRGLILEFYKGNELKL